MRPLPESGRVLVGEWREFSGGNRARWVRLTRGRKPGAQAPDSPAATPSRTLHELHHENGNTDSTGPYHWSEDAAGSLRSRPSLRQPLTRVGKP